MKIAKPSVQSLFIQMQFGGQLLSTGTGFVIYGKSGLPYLITNRHNVTGRDQNTGEPLSATAGVPDEVVVLHNAKGRLGHWVPRLEPLYENNKQRWFEHPTLGAKADFVALPLTQLDNVEIYAFEPDNDGINIRVGPADAMSVLGFPFGLAAGGVFAVWATGFFASEPSIDYAGLPLLLIDCRTRPGQSGSPVIVYRSGGAVLLSNGDTAVYSGPVHQLVGIYSGRLSTESDLGLVWKLSAIVELLDGL